MCGKLKMFPNHQPAIEHPEKHLGQLRKPLENTWKFDAKPVTLKDSLGQKWASRPAHQKAISLEARTAGVEENQLKSTGTVGRFQQRLQILGQIQSAKEPGWIPMEEPDAMEIYQLGNLMMYRCCVCFAMPESSES